MSLTTAERISRWEGKNLLLWEDQNNPYESIYIRACVEQGRLSLTDSQCDHAPDGGWSHIVLEFDEENSGRVIEFLSEDGKEPFAVLKGMLDSQNRSGRFVEECQVRNIAFKKKFCL